MMMTAIGPPIDTSLLDRVEELQAAAEYIRVLIEVTQSIALGVKDRLRSFGYVAIEQAEDWRQIQTLLSLANDQAAIVRGVSIDVEAARLAAVRPKAA